MNERLGKAYVEYEVYRSHIFSEADAPEGSVFKSEQLGLPAGGKGYILTDHTFKVYPKKFDKGMAPRSIGLKLCNKNLFFESFRTKPIAKTFEVHSKSLRIMVTQWYGKFFVPISAENGGDAVKNLIWKAKVDPSKYPKHPGVSAGKARSGKLSSHQIDLITTSIIDVNLPAAAPTDPGSFVGATVTEASCPIEIFIEFEGAKEGLGLAGQGRQAGENLVVYNAAAPESFVDVLLHELGHSMGQTVYSGIYLAPKGLPIPKRTNEEDSIYAYNGTKGHTYVEKGHSGSHCAYGLNDTEKASDSYPGKPGTCIMFGENSGTGPSLAVTGFCPQCIDYIKARELNDLSVVLE